MLMHSFNSKPALDQIRSNSATDCSPWHYEAHNAPAYTFSNSTMAVSAIS